MKRGQASVFIILGLIVLIVIIFVFLGSMGSKDSTSQEITEILNIDQAKDALETCIEEEIEESFFLMGTQGGYLIPKNNSYFFLTTYDILTVEEMESNMESYLETTILECETLLEDSEFTLEKNGIDVMASFENRAEITVDWPVKVIYGEKQETISQITESFNVNLNNINEITNNLFESDYGFPIEPYESFIINIFTTGDYTESLVEIYYLDEEFKFRIVKLY